MRDELAPVAPALLPSLAVSTLYYGDNLDVLRRKIPEGTIDLCYIDPPFNSKRNYNQIYNNIGAEDRAQAQAFIDTWTWDGLAIAGYAELLANDAGRFQRQTIELIKGLHAVLGEGSLLAYLVSMTLRLVEIHRVLKPSGSFYLHCDPTASHYLKIVLDGIFCSQRGEFRNEIAWCYRKWSIEAQQFARNHDVLLFYTKSSDGTHTFNPQFAPVSKGTMKRWKGKRQRAYFVDGVRKATSDDDGAAQTPMPDWWEISIINPNAKERLGYPTQKPEELLERIILTSTNEDDVVLDAYCGCGTTIAIAQRFKRQWIGMDITFQSISLVLKRLADGISKDVADAVTLDGVPKDMDSASALAHKQDDRVRKEFEKWAVLTYTSNRGIINDKKGADGGIDGTVYFLTGPSDNATMVFSVKSGGVGRGDIAKLRGDMDRAGAAMATLITLEPPTAPMIAEAKAAGHYHHAVMGRNYDTIQIVTVAEMLEQGRLLDLPLSSNVLKESPRIDAVPLAPTLPGIVSTPVPSRAVAAPPPEPESAESAVRPRRRR